MAQLIGTDEAGYGPNLGPLTICGTRWEVDSTEVDLFEALAEIVSQSPDANRIQICDSKSVYKSQGSIKNLETTVLATLFAKWDLIPGDVLQFGELIGAQFNKYPHPSFLDPTLRLTLPVAADQEHIAELGGRFRKVCRQQNVRLLNVMCRAVFPDRFNALIATHGNKAEVLSTQTMKIVGSLLEFDSSENLVVCDKHGGRSKYLGLINKELTDQFVSVECETQRISEYHWEAEGRDYQMRFIASGESFLPVALSSMFAKYARELCMNIWNDFWSEKIPGIRPTKGYPVDAKRFKQEIATEQRRLGIADDLVWRIR